MESDIDPYDGSENWIDTLLEDPANREAVAREVRAVADEIAADPAYGGEDQVGPDEEGAAASASSRRSASRPRSLSAPRSG